jgi:N-acetylglucosamine-6-sulfatase
VKPFDMLASWRATFIVLVLVLSVNLCLYFFWYVPDEAAQESTKPNFVFILADDMSADLLEYMPKTRSLLGREGMQFDNAYVSNGLCCPSRATILRGQYAHNTGVWRNVNATDGGWEGYKDNGNEQDNLATHFDEAGYRTALLGKYLNQYEGTTVPPGWDHWFATYTFDYFNYNVNDNGTVRHFGTGQSDYLTDVLSQETQQFIGDSVAQGDPFFAYVAPIAPHGPATPAPRDTHAFDGEQATRLPSFNEQDVSDKPPWIRSLPRLTTNRIAQLNKVHEEEAESLQALDDLVEGVVAKLGETGALGNTYIVFTSDNGSFRGEHRIPTDKARPYEEAIHMPLLVRGPGVAAGSTSELALNTDFFPTFTDLAGVSTPDYVDGRSLRPLLEGDTSATWRSAILLEARQTSLGGNTPAHSGIRTSSGKKYLEYEGGFKELYDLKTDPYELVNSYRAAAPPADLATRLKALKSCAGSSCRAAEGGQ